MKSIKTKLFLIYTVTLVLLILLFMIINSSFLKEYYVYSMEKNFVAHYDNLLATKSTDSLLRYLSNLTRNEGIHSMIIDSHNNILYDSLIVHPEEKGSHFLDTKIKKVPKYIGEIFIKNKNMNADNYYYGTVIAENGKEDILFFQKLGEQYYVIMYKAAYIINENANIANQFFAYVGIGLIIIGSIFILAFSKKVTRPIIELKEITEKIAAQDFSHKFLKKSDDELGQLGGNINYMSEKLNEAMTRLKEDIERKEAIDNMRKNFIASVSHELKTPIGLIKGYVEGIKYNVSQTKEEKEAYFDVIIHETDRMNKILQELLVLSSMESEVNEMVTTIFNIAVLIDEVTLKFNQVFEEKSIKVIKEVDDDIFVKADYMKIEQVLTNYIMNAINHLDDNKEIKISLKGIDSQGVVTVYNSGNKIPEKELENIWGSFYKVDKARTRKYGGTGLGLSIVRVIIEKHQGQYGVKNMNNGVAFWFSLDEYIK